MLNIKQKKILLELARDTLTNFLEKGIIRKFEIEDKDLAQKAGAFISLYNRDELRGCVGIIETEQRLYETIIEMTIEAATNDPRFSPVKKGELNDISFIIPEPNAWINGIIRDQNGKELTFPSFITLYSTNKNITNQKIDKQLVKDSFIFGAFEGSYYLKASSYTEMGNYMYPTVQTSSFNLTVGETLTVDDVICYRADKYVYVRTIGPDVYTNRALVFEAQSKQGFRNAACTNVKTNIARIPICSELGKEFNIRPLTALPEEYTFKLKKTKVAISETLIVEIIPANDSAPKNKSESERMKEQMK